MMVSTAILNYFTKILVWEIERERERKVLKCQCKSLERDFTLIKIANASKIT